MPRCGAGDRPALHCRQNTLLRAMAEALEDGRETILAANARDMEAAAAKGITGAMLDRLKLDEKRLAGIASAVREVAELPDPVGQVTREETRPNGIHIQRMRVPLGVVAMIYEARPNVTADAAALCLKAGNGVILRGGSEAIHSNTAIAAALRGALCAQGLPEAALTLVEDLRRETMVELLQLNDVIDLAIPRGGEGLIRFVAEHARVPVIKHYKGVCHLFVDASADPRLALRLLLDGKASRPGCAMRWKPCWCIGTSHRPSCRWPRKRCADAACRCAPTTSHGCRCRKRRR